MKIFNKKAGFDISSQSIFWLPRILFMIAFVLVVTAPIGCYSKNQQEQLKLIKSQNSELSLIELKNCLEISNLDKEKTISCLNNKNLGATIKTYSNSFVINQEVYQEKDFCNLNKNYICKQETSLLKINNELKKVEIDLVIINE